MVPFDLDDMILTSRVLRVEPGAPRSSQDSRSAPIGDLLVPEGDRGKPKHVVVDADLPDVTLARGHRPSSTSVETLVTLCHDGQVVARVAPPEAGI